MSSAIPPVSTIDAAKLTLGVIGVAGPGGPLSVHRALHGPTMHWDEGNADAPGSEITGAASGWPAADWQYRSRPYEAWSAPGGDFLAAPLVETLVSPPQASSLLDLSSEELRASVQEMASTGADDDGFVLEGPDTPGAVIQIASRESTPGQRPTLHVDYTKNEIYESGILHTGVVTFVDEGQNFRWIYDVDHDDIAVTSIGGLCQVVDPTPSNFLHYTYRYQGSPGYTGVDCCVWQIDAPQTGTIGTGQALFFHNLDASDPANMPPDTDQDGIRNPCDNCAQVPNGPLRGSCLSGTLGTICRSNSECGAGGICSLSQEDANVDFTGDACAVPESSPVMGLVAGVGVLTAWSRRSRCPPAHSAHWSVFQ